MQYSVKNPHDSGGHIVYEVHGMDDQGEWEGLRSGYCMAWLSAPSLSVVL